MEETKQKCDFKPFQKVLVRIGDTWYGDFFSHTDEEGCNLIGGGVPASENLLPYEGNEHLLGTTDNPKQKWQPKPGELVAVRDLDNENWVARRFICWEGHSARTLCESCDELDEVWRYCEPLRKHFNVPEE